MIVKMEELIKVISNTVTVLMSKDVVCFWPLYNLFCEIWRHYHIMLAGNLLYAIEMFYMYLM